MIGLVNHFLGRTQVVGVVGSRFRGVFASRHVETTRQIP